MNPDEIEGIMTLTRRIDGFRYHLDYRDDPLASFCMVMFNALLADRRYDVIERALDAHDEHRVRIEADFQCERDRRATAYAEQERRHAIAIKVDCPYCGQPAGSVCRRNSPVRASMGIAVHADRYRAACGLLDGELQELTGQ